MREHTDSIHPRSSHIVGAGVHRALKKSESTGLVKTQKNISGTSLSVPDSVLSVVTETNKKWALLCKKQFFPSIMD